MKNNEIENQEDKKTENKVIIIALCGSMRSGKDTLANYLRREHGFTAMGFGDALRHVAGFLYPEIKTDRVAYRKRMQDIGQHMRAYDADIWVRILKRAIDTEVQFDVGRKIVITDMRQPNEYEAMRAMGAKIVLVDCDLETCANRAGAEAAMMNHSTEGHYAGFQHDFIIDNNGTVESLHEQADRLVSAL